MDISNINNNNSDLWKGLQDAIETLDSLKGTDVGTVLGADGTNLTVTFTGTDGVARTIQLELPEIEEGATAPDPEVVEALLDKIDEMAAELEAQAAPSIDQLEKMVQATGANAQSTGFRKALFDVYSLMCLMVDLATAQREVARNLRQQELIGQVASIQAKATAARTTALVGMLTSVAMTVVQIGASAIAAKISHNASKAANQGETLGLKSARVDIKILNTANKNPAGMTNVVNSYKAALPPGVADEINTGLDTAVNQAKVPEATATKLQNAQTKLDNANNTLNECQKTVDADQKSLDVKTAELGKLEEKISGLEAKVKDGTIQELDRVELSGLKKQATQLRNEVKAAKSTLDGSTKELAKAKTAAETAQGEKNEAQTQYDTELKDAQAKAMDAFMNGEDSEYTAALSDLKQLKNMDPPDKAAIKAQEGKVQELANRRNYAKALVTSKKLEAGFPIAEDIAAAKTKVEQLENVLPNDSEFKALMAKSMKWQSISAMAAQMTGLVNAISGFASACEQTAVAEKESEAARREAYRQESTELQESAQKLLDSVLQTLRELVQMESGSLDRIIGNI